MLTVKNLSKEFVLEKERIIALTDVNFEVNNGEFFTVIGPSGCGKSTLLKIIAGLEKPSMGEIHWNQTPKTAFVFQNFALFPYLTVFENIEFGLKMRGIPKNQREKIVKELLLEVALEEFKEKHPQELSGGMKQRVGIARALAIDPNIILLDEPFSSLDEFTAESLRNLMLGIWNKRKMTVILITHLISEALQLSDRIAVLSPAPGTVEKILENNLKRPRDLRSQEFFDFEDNLKRLIKP